jgi:hypothetical protein
MIVLYARKAARAAIQYAGFVSEALNCPLLRADKVNPKDLDEYDDIILAGETRGGKFLGAETLMSVRAKRLTVFSVGHDPAAALSASLPDAVLRRVSSYNLAPDGRGAIEPIVTAIRRAEFGGRNGGADGDA